jgi:benzoate/toluate 1,2-dioxygenase reductase subunit
MPTAVKIISVEQITHDVLQIKATKPSGLQYLPGQAVDIAINKQGWDDKLSAFTFTSLPEDDFIEFTIKIYTSRQRVTNELLTIKSGDEILIFKPFGDIQYKGEGIFIAGGAGITPFIAIIKSLQKQHKIGRNKLIFANKTKADIIAKMYFDKVLGDNFINVLSDDMVEGFEHGFINATIIEKYNQEHLKYYYLCGPKPMMEAVENHLATLGVNKENIIKEGF